MTQDKACTRCKQQKPLSDYTTDKRHKDGRASQCRECDRARYKKYTAKPEAKVTLALTKRVQYAANPDKHRQRRARYRRNNVEPTAFDRDPFKEAARRAFRSAVQRGHLVRPDRCEDCGKTGPLHGHHENYSKPLDVAWVCPPCHGRRHRKYHSDNRSVAIKNLTAAQEEGKP